MSGKWFQLDFSEKSEARGKIVEDKLGRSVETVFLGEAADLPVKVIIHLRHYVERSFSDAELEWKIRFEQEDSGCKASRLP